MPFSGKVAFSHPSKVHVSKNSNMLYDRPSIQPLLNKKEKKKKDKIPTGKYFCP